MKSKLDLYVEKHRQLWDSIVTKIEDGTIANFNDFLFNKKKKVKELVEFDPNITKIPISNCFLCEYATCCDFCPCRSIESRDSLCLDGLYMDFTVSLGDIVRYDDRQKALMYAKRIRDLPIVNRKGERYEKEN